jgi:hypothetical protein
MCGFQVWIRPLGSTSRVRVDGKENAIWLLDRLAQSFVFKNSEPVRDEGYTSFCSFQIAYSPQVSHTNIAKLLAAIPEVTLNIEPA